MRSWTVGDDFSGMRMRLGETSRLLFELRMVKERDS